MVKVWKIAIPELTGKKKRRAYVYLPNSYRTEHHLHYPVLYMFDGQNIFFDSHATYGKSWGLKDYLDFTDTPLIVVAVECNDSPDHGRLREYSPYSFNDPSIGRIKGRGKITMDWIVHILKPMIDSRFRTLPSREYTFIAGSSMGGLMSLYALIEYNQVFGRAAALSPSVWTNVKKLVHLIQTSPLSGKTVLYMDYGSDELQNHPSMLKKYEKVSQAALLRGIYITSRIVPNGTHSEASWERQLPFVIETFMYDLKYPDEI